MIIFGGFDDGNRSNKVFFLNLDTKVWDCPKINQDQQPKPRTGHSAVVYGERMIIFGGKNDENEKMNDVWVLDLIQWTWSQIKYTSED